MSEYSIKVIESQNYIGMRITNKYIMIHIALQNNITTHIHSEIKENNQRNKNHRIQRAIQLLIISKSNQVWKQPCEQIHRCQ